jgi:hypothetical protein
VFYALIRKELRLHRLAIIVAVVVAAAGEVLLPLVSYLADLQQDPSMPPAKQWRNVIMAGHTGTGMALTATLLFAAVFGGGSTAIERRERWIDLAAMLPVGRLQRWSAAALTGAFLTLTMFIVHASVTRWFFKSDDMYGFMPVREMTTIGSLSIGAFGLSKLASVWMRSPALIVTIVCGSLVSGWMLADYLQQQSGHTLIVYTERGARHLWDTVDYKGPYQQGTAAIGVLALIASFPIAARRASS